MSKKFLKSLLSLTLAIAVIFPTFNFVFAAVDEEPQIIVSQATGNSGETVDVTVSLANNPGIVSMTLRMKYDSNILTLKGFTDAGVLGVQMHKPQLTNPHTLCWVNDTATENFMANGTILTYHFEINKDVPANSVSPVEIYYTPNNYDIYDKDVNQIDFKIVNGQVAVKSTDFVNHYKEQIRFQKNADGTYANKFDYRYLAKITEEDFIATFGTEENAINSIKDVGFVFTEDNTGFDMDLAKQIVEGKIEKVPGYVKKPIHYISTAFGDYTFSCIVTNIPDNEKNDSLNAIGYIVYEKDGVIHYEYYSDVVSNTFIGLYEKYFTTAFPITE